MDQKNLSLKIFFDEWEKLDESEKLDSLPPNPKKKILTRVFNWSLKKKNGKKIFSSKSWS